VPHGAAATVNAAVLTLTVGFGAVAMALLVTAAEGRGSRAGAASGLIYGLTLEASAVCSFLYNLLPSGVRRPILRYLDHTAIFLLIAGTYTPLAVCGLPQPFGYRLLTVVWGLTLLGVFLKLFLDARYDRLFVPFYLGIGLSVLVGFQDVMRTMSGPAVSLVVLGGVAYVTGAVIFLRDQGPWTDAIWHILVLAGAIAHFVAIYIVLC
jgi:hemolysin III